MQLRTSNGGKSYSVIAFFVPDKDQSAFIDELPDFQITELSYYISPVNDIACNSLPKT